MTMIDLDNIDTTNVDDDETDLSTLDRGDTPVVDEVVDEPGDKTKDEPGDKPEAKGAAKRDDKGRFKPKAEVKDEVVEGEEEEEEEAEEEEEEEADDDDDAGAAKKDNLPIRLNKMKEQRDAARRATAALEARLAAIEKQVTPKAEPKVDPAVAINTELDDLYEKVEGARLDGDIKVAAQLQRKIDSLNRDLVNLDAQKIAVKTSAATTENARYDAMLEQYETAYDVLNPKADDFDPKAVQALEYYVDLHEKGGMTATQALRQTVKLLFGNPPVKEEPAAKKDDVVVPIKKKVDPKKAIETSKKQPPDASQLGANKDDTSINPGGLTEEEFDALPEKKKAAMRGDFG